MDGYEGLRSAVAWIDLSDRGKIRVTGEDRARLLHAMSTNDIEHLADHKGVYAFFLNAVGRILADAYIFNLGDNLLLDTEPETANKLMEHLDKYIIADDATLENEKKSLVCFGLEGPMALETATKLGFPTPAERYAVADFQSGFVARVASTGPEGLRFFLPKMARASIIGRFEEAAVPHANSSQARLVRIENGMPRYGDDISERYLVQETQQQHAVHTNKGCYLGQEIVERVRSRGQVHRVLMPIRIEASDPPSPGTKLVAATDPAGEITSAEYSPGLGAVVGFAYVRTELANSKPRLTVAGSEPAITAAIR